MASEVVCGLIFRLLLPICLTVGECGPLTMVAWEGEEGAQRWGRASEQSKIKGSSIQGLGSRSPRRCPRARSVRRALSGVQEPGPSHCLRWGAGLWAF